MTTDFRALCVELTEQLHQYAEVFPEHNMDALVKRARAALADEPAAGERASVTEQPSDGDLDVLMYSIPWKGSPNRWGRQVVRAALTRWGNPAPQPPSEGEVAELVEWLYEQLHVCLQAPWTPGIKHFGRAANLLERLSPLQPVPVSERLPGPEDCDAEGRCWWGEPQIGDSHDATWNLCTQDEAEEYCTWGTKCGWLPATALPLPAVEVEP